MYSKITTQALSIFKQFSKFFWGGGTSINRVGVEYLEGRGTELDVLRTNVVVVSHLSKKLMLTDSIFCVLKKITNSYKKIIQKWL